jgi:catalase (peroxidase I)
VQTRSPGGAIQWEAKDADAIIPDAHDPSKMHKPTMLTTDLSLALRPDLREDLASLTGKSAGLRRSVRPRLV